MEDQEDFKLVFARDFKDQDIRFSDFEVMSLIGQGSISNVYLIRKKSTN